MISDKSLSEVFDLFTVRFFRLVILMGSLSEKKKKKKKAVFTIIRPTLYTFFFTFSKNCFKRKQKSCILIWKVLKTTNTNYGYKVKR